MEIRILTGSMKPCITTIRLIVLGVFFIAGIARETAAQDSGGPSALDYRNSGTAKFAKGDLQGAVADYDQAIAIEPKFSLAYSDRANAKHAKGDLAGAIADYDQAIKLYPQFFQAYIDRGITKQDKGNLKEALDDYNNAIEIDPEKPVGYNNIAWILATASDPSIRNGAKAVKCALIACELTNWQSTALYGTLAAAYAETGDFDQAVIWQSKYLQSHSGSKDAQYRLMLYKDHHPCHETMNKIQGNTD